MSPSLGKPFSSTAATVAAAPSAPPALPRISCGISCALLLTIIVSNSPIPIYCGRIGSPFSGYCRVSWGSDRAVCTGDNNWLVTSLPAGMPWALLGSPNHQISVSDSPRRIAWDRIGSPLAGCRLEFCDNSREVTRRGSKLEGLVASLRLDTNHGRLSANPRIPPAGINWNDPIFQVNAIHMAFLRKVVETKTYRRS